MIPPHPDPPVSPSALEQLRDDATSRKRFLRMMGAGGAAGLSVLLAACGDGDAGGTAAPTATGPAANPPPAAPRTVAASAHGDVKIVNFALLLEHVEAEFYRQVVASGALKAGKVLELAKTIAQNEREHVDALTATVMQLGGKPVAKPATTFDGVLGGGADKIIATAAMVENLGASAYLGQAAGIRSKKVLAEALSIHTVEARHAAALNKLAGHGFKGPRALTGSLPNGAFAKPMTRDAVLVQVKPFLA